MKYKWCQRIARAMLPCFVFFVFSFSFAPKAHAADAEVAVAYGAYRQYFYTTGALGGTGNYINTATSPVYDGAKQVTYGGGSAVFDAMFYTGSGVQFYSPTKVYFSYYPRGSGGTVTIVGDLLDESSWDVTYTNSYNEPGVSVGGLDSYRAIASSSSRTGYIYAVEASFEGSELFPVSDLQIKRKDFSDAIRWASPNNTGEIFFPSIRIISAQYSEEMEALDKVADAIAAQSDILLAMKGDLVAILQDIYQMTGDMYSAQNLLNTYVSQLLPLLENIDQTTTDIYSLLSTQLRLLETAIENAASSIERAIEAQTAAMIAFLEELLNTGNEVPEGTYNQTQDAENIIGQLGEMNKPNVDTVVPELDDYSNADVSGVLNAIFGSSLVLTMMTLSVSLAFGAYVLFGKRD